MATSALKVQLVDPADGTPYKSAGSSGSADGNPPSGNPTLVAGSDGTNTRTLLTGTTGGLILGDAGGSTNARVIGAAADATSASFPGLVTLSRNYVYNGATWDRARGDLNGAYAVSKGGSNIATGQAAVTTSSTLVVAARTGRQKVTLSPTSSVVYYVGNTGVTTATGVYVAAGATITLDTAAAIYAVGASAVTISYVEFY